MRRWLPSLLVVLAVVTACGDDDGATADPNPTTTAATTTTAAATTTAAPTTSAAPTTTSTTPVAPRPAIPDPAASTLADLLALGRPVVIGHAGGDQSWPKSTMYAFHEAAAAGADVLEMDVQLSGDGTLVVLHDDTVEGTTGGTGRVRDLSVAELQALDQAHWWSTEWANRDLPDDRYVFRGIRTGETGAPPGYTADDFKVETFATIAETFPAHVLDIEIKIPRGDDGEDDLEFAIAGARALADEIEALDRTDSVVVVSFNDEVIEAFHDFAPDVVTSPGLSTLPAWYLEDGELLESHQILQIPPFFTLDGVELEVLRLPGFIDKATAEGRTIWVWPDRRDQENADFYAMLVAEFDIGGILAGRPDEAVERYRAEGWIP